MARKTKKLLAKNLIEILQKNPEAEVKVGWEEIVPIGELTTGSDDRIEPVHGVWNIDGKIVISAEAYLAGERLWRVDQK